MPNGKYKQRKKAAPTSQNTLFIEWLTEWKEEAASRELKTHYTYAKALCSLKKYPITLYSGKECKLLEGFGDKLCQMIDDRLSRYMADLGTGQSAKEVIDSHKMSVTSSETSSKRLKPSTTWTNSSCKAMAVVNCFSIESGSESENESLKSKHVGQEQSSKQSNARKFGVSGRGQEYIPQKNSGAYALLIVLYRQRQENEDADCFMTKKELMSVSQPLATKSFTVPDPGSHYTAWSSMGTLLKKELVTRQSCPAQYRITSTGVDLARRLLQADENISVHLPVSSDECKQLSSDRKTFKKARTAVSSASDYAINDDAIHKENHYNYETENDTMGAEILFEDREKLQPVECNKMDEEEILPCMLNQFESISSGIEQGSGSNVPLTGNIYHLYSADDQSFSFSYINEADEEVASKDKAVVCIDEEISVGFLIKTRYEDLLMSAKRYKLDHTRSSSGEFVFAYLNDEDAPSLSTALKSMGQMTAVLELRNEEKMSKDAESCGDSKSSKASSSAPGKTTKQFSFKPKTSGLINKKDNCRTSETESATGFRSIPRPNRPLEKQISSLSTANASMGMSGEHKNFNSKSGTTSEELGEPDFVFLPGTFDVVLYVDNHEYYSGSNYNGEMLIKELNRNGVRYKVCNLQIGDFLWVAAERTGGSSDGTCRALVLDYIIERKRMDDLASSIIDGRFKEQKFRLRGCGLSNPIYLVEDYGSMQHFSIPEDSLNQAIINTQVIEGFFVKRTKDTKETAAYLFLMTRYLESINKNKTLFGYQRQFKYSKGTGLDSEERLMMFDIFNESSAKTKALTVAETFGKHLMQLHGLTAEKASAVLGLYPTPKLLYEAYQKCSSDKEREELLANIKYGMTKRNFGKQMSKALSILYYTSGKLS